MSSKNRPYFLWDYDLTENDVRRILHGKNETEKFWLMGRILTSAHFNDVWKYLTVKDVVKYFSKLRVRPQVRKMWQSALQVWGYNV